MSKPASDPSGISDRKAWIWLGLAVVFSLVASGRWALAPAAWLAPLFALRFARSHTPVRGYLILSAATVPVLGLGWSFFPFGGAVGFAIFCLSTSLFGNLPYLLDRWLSPASGWLRTLPYPLSVVALEWFSAQGAYGSWGATGYSQLELLPVAQFVSVAGLGGLSFAIAWVATLGNDIWERWGARDLRGPVLACAGVVTVIAAWAGARLLVTPSTGAVVRIAAIAAPPRPIFPNVKLESRWRAKEALSTSDVTALATHHRDRIAALVEQTHSAAAKGAKLVVWSEAAAIVTDTQERALIELLSGLARERKILLAATLLVLPTAGTAKWDNKVVLFSADGHQVWSYRKSVPTPGGEAAVSLRGDGVMPVHDAPWGRIAPAICYDADFPDLLAQASRQRVDVVIVPAGDWPEVADIHADMARMRAIEQGVTIVRPAAAGRSSIIDPLGRVLGSDVQRGDSIPLLLRDVPVARIATPHRYLADLFAAICVLMLSGWATGAAAWSLARRVRRTVLDPAVEGSHANSRPPLPADAP